MTKCSMLTSELAAQDALRGSDSTVCSVRVLRVDHMVRKEMYYVLLLAATHNTSLARYACDNVVDHTVTKSGIAVVVVVVVGGAV